MRRRYLFLTAGLAGGLLVGILLGAVLRGSPAASDASATLTTQYQMVVLTNGQTLVGKLEKIGTAYPVLYDAHSVAPRTDQEPRDPASALVRRGTEWHEPDILVLNAQHILFVEPVKPGSVIAKLIEDMKKK
jgi:hypothetical protein